MKKVLVLGGTGAMGRYLVPLLAEMDYQVDVVSLDETTSPDPRVRCIRADAKDVSFRSELLKNGYDGVVDFLIYQTAEFREKHMQLLQNTGHYIYLSSYRIYADEETPVRETSPRLLDVSPDREFLATEDYSLYKARGEDILRQSGLTNWTIIRPAITYSTGRLQLTTLELDRLMARLKNKQTLVLPEAALDIQATMSWGGDVAQMIARLLFNEKAIGETFSVCTAEHHTWREIAEMYREICGVDYAAASTPDYVSIIAGPDASPAYRKAVEWQLIYDRCFTRVMDNSKILAVTGLTQESLMPLRRGLETEYRNTLSAGIDRTNAELSARMDEWLSRQKG